MKVIKRFNNNVVLCIDDNQKELIAFGKALGFHEIPYELHDLSKIEKSYYGIEKRYLNMINELSEISLELSRTIMDWCRMKLEGQINPNMIFTMADHIDFCIERSKKNIKVKMPLYNDFENLHSKEFKIAQKAVRLINKKAKIHLSDDEAIGITMNIINAEMDLESNQAYKDAEIIQEEVLKIIEDNLQIIIDKKSTNYARYLSHMQYLIKRIEDNSIAPEINFEIYENVFSQYPEISNAILKIAEYFKETKNYELNHDELFYLLIHITRLTNHEECYHSGITSKE